MTRIWLHLGIALFLTLALPATNALAKTRYVSDQMVITLRSGQGNQFEIIKTMPSGLKLELLEENEAGYAHVRTPDGVEGWVRTQYLTDKPIASVQLEALQTKYDRLNEGFTSMKQELVALKTENKTVTKERDDLRNANTKMNADIERMKQVAGKPILIDQENRELKEQTVRLTTDLQLVRQENQAMRDRSDKDWFIAGAGVLLFGLVIGLIIPRVRWRKKTSWDF